MKPIILSCLCVEYDPINEWIPDNPLNVDFKINFTIGLEKLQVIISMYGSLQKTAFKNIKELSVR